MPQGIYCGFPHIQSTQLLAKLYHKRTSQLNVTLRRNSVVLITRSHGRRFTKTDEIRSNLQKLTLESDLRFVEFSDRALPSITETMVIFYEAVLVVGPHGAGFSNLIYSQPGTYVIEGVCNPPHTNLCYQRSAHILGHHYHAIMSERGCVNVVDVDPQQILNTAKAFLKSYKMENDGTLTGCC